MNQSGRFEQMKLVATLGIGLLAGCSSTAIQPKVGLLEQTPPYMYSDADWAEVLTQHVRDGLVNYKDLAEHAEPLQRYYAILSKTGPSLTADQFSSRQQVVAYWVNAYNALVLLAVLQHYPISTIHDLSLPSLSYDYQFFVDGQTHNLAWIEEKALQASGGDVRVLFAMSGAALGTPGLLKEPLRSTILERQLSDAAAVALDNPNVLRIDHPSQSILVWQEVLTRQETFLAYWRSQRRASSAFLFNVLLELASPAQRQALQSAVGYTFRGIAFDRSLNDSAPVATASQSE